MTQAHAKQQWRQMSAAAEATEGVASKVEATTATATGRVYGSRTRVPIESHVDVMSLTDGEDILPSSAATSRARWDILHHRFHEPFVIHALFAIYLSGYEGL